MKNCILPALPLTLVLLACSIAPSARATLLFSNATDATGGGSNWFSYGDGLSNPGVGLFVAQDFVLAGSATLTSLTFNAYTDTSTSPVSFINVKIYADNGGVVGNELFSGGSPSYGMQFTQTLYGRDLYDFTTSLLNWNLAAGIYWLGLKVDPAADVHFLAWSAPEDYLLTGPPYTYLGAGPYGSYVGDGTGDAASYTNGYDWEHVFRLDGTTSASAPDAGSSVVLLGLALAGLGLMRRKIG